jgi:chromosome segregation ATPase
MQIKDEGNDNGKKEVDPRNLGLDQLTHSNLNTNRGGGIVTGRDLNDTGLSSTFKSIDLPPKEYEQQLQQYEAEVRNHIKVEQQLKLHIEVLNEKIEEFEKEKEELRMQITNDFKSNEKKLKEKLKSILD